MFNSKHGSDSALLMHAETAMCYIIVVALTLPVKTVQQYLSQESCSRLCRDGADEQYIQYLSKISITLPQVPNLNSSISAFIWLARLPKSLTEDS